MCPLVNELKRRPQVQTVVCVTGQHKQMLQQVLDAFSVVPDYDLAIMQPNQTLFDVTTAILTRIQAVLNQEKPDLTLVHGDTSTAFVTALACFYLHIPVGHVEAGLRTYNLESPFPEEFNRQAVSLICRYHFAPTEKAKQNLLLAWNLSVLLASANLLAFPMVCALPLKRIAARLAKSGSAVAGFFGADAIRRSNCVILTDGDIFPPGTVTLGGLKTFGEESGKVISYAATMAHASESGLSRLFNNLLASDGGFRETVEDVDFYEEGGVGGRIHGETVLFGTASFMRKRGVNLPRNLGLKTGVFLSVDGTLIAVFAVKYMPAENVDWALHALHHSRITPVLAVRDGNITPALLKRKFGTDARAVYPKLGTRLALSERGGGRPYALLMREGLMPYAEVVLGSKRLCLSARRGTVLAFLAATASTLLAFYLTFVGAYSELTPLSLLVYLLLWSLSVLVDGMLSDRY
mgnify:CR=1 FL=1